MPDASDMELVREFARTQSEPAFAELVRRHINLVYSVAWRYTSQPQDAEDVTQAVFIILAKKAARLRERTVLGGWLYETTRFTATRLLRAKARRAVHEQEAGMESTLNESDTGGVWRQLAPHLEEGMSRLGARDRTLLVLRFYENKSGAETAAMLGIREDAAHKRTARALEKLWKFFTRRGIILSAVAIVGAVSANSVQAAPAGLAKAVSAVAAAKGAAAGGSTLALVKGALKVMAWTKVKTAIIVGTGILVFGSAAIISIGGKSADEISAEHLFVVSNLLANPPDIQECIYLRKAAGAVEYWRVGSHGADYYALKFAGFDKTTDGTNATEGHGRFGNISWNFHSGILNASDEADPNESYWQDTALQPLELGMPLLRKNTIQFKSPTNFEAVIDFNGEKISGLLGVSRSAQSNDCVIFYVRGGNKIPVWTATLNWPPAGLFASRDGLPDEIRLSVGPNRSIQSPPILEMTVKSIILLSRGSSGSDFSPEKIAADCKRKIVFKQKKR